MDKKQGQRKFDWVEVVKREENLLDCVTESKRDSHWASEMKPNKNRGKERMKEKLFNGITTSVIYPSRWREVQLPVSFTEDATADLSTLSLPEFKLRLTAELGVPPSYLGERPLGEVTHQYPLRLPIWTPLWCFFCLCLWLTSPLRQLLRQDYNTAHTETHIYTERTKSKANIFNKFTRYFQ